METGSGGMLIIGRWKNVESTIIQENPCCRLVKKKQYFEKTVSCSVVNAAFLFLGRAAIVKAIKHGTFTTCRYSTVMLTYYPIDDVKSNATHATIQPKGSM